MNTHLLESLVIHPDSAREDAPLKHFRVEVDAERMAWITFDMAGSPVNVWNLTTLREFNHCLDVVAHNAGIRGLIIRSAKERVFIAGADLKAMRIAPARKLEELIDLGQSTFNRLASMKMPKLALIHGACVGGGLELALACDARIASDSDHTRLGLPETQIGLIPAWGGVTRTLIRSSLRGLPDPAARAFALASSSVISGSAFEAQAEGLLLPSDEIVMNAARVLERAKAAALERVGRPRRPEPERFALHDPRLETLDAAWSDASPTDRRIVGALAAMLTGDEPVTEAELLRREIEVALKLVVLPANQDRMRHMLATNKPLEN